MVGIGILSWIGLGLLGGFIAAKKGYPPTAGVLVGMFFGPVGLVVAAVMPRLRGGASRKIWNT